MRDPDINRVKKALSHITTARQFLDKIQWLNTDPMEWEFIKKAQGQIKDLLWTLDDILHLNKTE